MTARFADTFYFLALGNPDDPAHATARRLAADPGIRLVTTAWVLTEVGDALCAPINRAAFLRLCRRLAQNSATEIVPPSLDDFERGIDLFARRPTSPGR